MRRLLAWPLMYGGGLAFWWLVWHAPRAAAVQQIVHSLPAWSSAAGAVIFFAAETARWFNRRLPTAGSSRVLLASRLWWVEFAVTPFLVACITSGSQRSVAIILFLWLAFFFASAYDTIREERRAVRAPRLPPDSGP